MQRLRTDMPVPRPVEQLRQSDPLPRGPQAGSAQFVLHGGRHALHYTALYISGAMRFFKRQGGLLAIEAEQRDTHLSMRRYEPKDQPLAPRHIFKTRLLKHLLAGALITALTLLIGTAGYIWLAGMTLVDAFYNAAMIFSGMGPADPLPNAPAKVFAGIYAIVCGLLLLAVAGIVMAPVFHRLLHQFHIDQDD
jgi:hypothetical protein